MNVIVFVGRTSTLFRNTLSKNSTPLRQTNQMLTSFAGFTKAMQSSSLTFFALGDFGEPTPAVVSTAKSMEDWAVMTSEPSFVLALGT